MAVLAAGRSRRCHATLQSSLALEQQQRHSSLGDGAIEASAGKFDDSLKLFAEAEKGVGSQLNFSVDYAKALGKAGAAKGDDALLKDAYDRFDHIYQRAPQNTLNLQNWAITLSSVGRYSDAWAKVKLAESTPNKAFLDPRFLANLESKMPRPKD